MRSRTIPVVVATTLFFAGCARLTISAAISVNPVMFGPVKTLGAGLAPRKPGPVPEGTAFRHSEETLIGQIAAPLGVAWGCGGTSVLSPPSDDESGRDWRASRSCWSCDPPWLDWRVVRATGEDPSRRIDLTSIRCWGGNAFIPPVLNIFSLTGCDLDGVVPAAEYTVSPFFRPARPAADARRRAVAGLHGPARSW